MKTYFVVLIVLCLSFTQAQTHEALLGTWQAQNNGMMITQTINQDGTYSFEAAAQDYFEKGTWQFDGTNYSQQWQDPNTGEAQSATYQLELKFPRFDGE